MHLVRALLRGCSTSIADEVEDEPLPLNRERRLCISPRTPCKDCA